MTTSTKNDFSGIWGDSSEHIRKHGTELAKKRPELGSQNDTKKKKKFGYLHVLLNYIALLVFSTILSVVYFPFTNGNPESLVSDPVFLLLSTAIMYFVWVGGAWISTLIGGTGSLIKDLWLRIKVKDVLWGLLFAGGFFGFTTGLGWLVSDVMGVNLESSDNTGTLTQFSGILLFIFAYGVGAIVGPFVEEVFFRGFVLQAGMNSFRKAKENADALGETSGILYKVQSFFFKSAPYLSLLVSSVIFGFMHYQPTEAAWYTILVTGSLGLLMGIITLKFKRLGPAIFAHMFFNAINVTLALTLV